MKLGRVDLPLFLTVLTLLGIGLVMVYSASSVEALVSYHDPTYFLKRQIMWSLVGLAAMFVAARIDYWKWARYAWPILAITMFLLLAVLVPHIGRDVNGARRWLGFGSLTFQPSEMSKISLVILFAATLTQTRFRADRFKEGVIPHLVALGIVCALIIKEPDLGTALALAGTVVTMMWVAGTPTAQLGGLAGVGLPLVLGLIMTSSYRRARFFAFLDPQKDPQGSGYHIIQSLYALGSGGLFGVGLGGSALKYFYLPEQHTDFIFAIIGEELGLIGTVSILLLFFLFAWRGLRIAMTAPDRFGAVLATGITCMIILQAFINMAVVTASVPITGIPLPFLSYGGSSLVFALAGVGILLNISKHCRRGLGGAA